MPLLPVSEPCTRILSTAFDPHSGKSEQDIQPSSGSEIRQSASLHCVCRPLAVLRVAMHAR